MLLCHSCKMEPSIVAHFDFEYPVAVTGKTPKDLAFVGYMKMFLKSTDPILETHIDIYPVRFLFFFLNIRVKLQFRLSEELKKIDCFQRNV